MEKETIDGFDIEKRELTVEEASREVTFDRIQDFHYSAGEDFVDQFGTINHLILGGYLMGKHPEISTEILKECNNKYGEALGLKQIYIDNFGEDDTKSEELFYRDLCEFINLTTSLKKRVNQILIQVEEHYKD